MLSRWDKFWFADEDPLPAAVMRISFGVLILMMYLALFPNWDRFFAADGLMSYCDADLRASQHVDWWCVFSWTEPLVPVQFYWWLGMMAAVAFTAGWRTRLATVILFVIQMSMIHRCPIVTNGEDLVFRLILFYGCFVSFGNRLSIDAYRNRVQGRDGENQLVSAWPIRLLQVHIVMIYAISLPYKISHDPSWLTGDALHWTIASDVWWHRGMFPELTYGFAGIPRKLMTWGTVLTEAAFPILVCFRKTRIWAVGALALLHLGIAILIPNVTLFSLAMVASFWMFVSADTIKKVGRQLAHLRNQGRQREKVLATTKMFNGIPPVCLVLIVCISGGTAAKELELVKVERLPNVVIDGSPAKIHTQGLYVTDDHFFVTGRLDTGRKRALLLRFSRSDPAEFEHVDITPTKKSDAGLDHPGGFDRDAEGVFWIPVSTSNPRGPTIVYGVSIDASGALSKAMTIRTSLRINDHLGAMCCLDDGLLLAANWDTKAIYWIDKAGEVVKKQDRSQFIATEPDWRLAVQDWKYDRKKKLLLAGGIDKSLKRSIDGSKAVVCWIDLKARKIVSLWRPRPRDDVSRPLTNEGVAWFKNQLFLLPEDLGKGAKVLEFAGFDETTKPAAK